MGIGARILELRTQAGLNQADFGKLIGVTSSAICNYENGRRFVGKQVILAICREFGVTEDWLRNGTEPKFVDTPAFDLGDYVRQMGASDLETQILKAYFELDKKTRRNLMESLKILMSSMPEGEKAGEETVVEAIAETVSSTFDADAETSARAEAKEVYRQVLEEKRAEDESLASPPGAGKMA